MHNMYYVCCRLKIDSQHRGSLNLVVCECYSVLLDYLLWWWLCSLDLSYCNHLHLLEVAFATTAELQNVIVIKANHTTLFTKIG